MVTESRWRRAQSYETGFWHSIGAQIESEDVPQLQWYGWRADQLAARLERLDLAHLTSGSAKVIEVGGGPIGVASFFPGSRVASVDPLADAYAADPSLVALRNADVEYYRGQGEDLRFPDATFDLAIIENCIDHVLDASAVLNELHRVLRPAGILYLTVNCRSRVGYYVHRILSRAGLDPGHTYTFTPDRIRGFVEGHGFAVLDLEALESYRAARRADWRSASFKDRVKALVCVSEYAVGLVARREGPG